MVKRFKKSLPKINISSQLLHDFFDHIPDVIYFKDRKGKLTFVNKAHAKGLGLEPKQVIGKTDLDIFPKARAARMAQDDEFVMKTGKPIIDKIERATRPDGIDNYVSTTKIPHYDKKGKIIGLFGITRDVTRRVRLEKQREQKFIIEKKIEAQEELKKTKSDFISTISHELRTPLSIIKQLLSLIYDETAGPVNNHQREILVKVNNNLDRLKTTVEKLLDASIIEGKRLRLHYSLASLKDILKDSEEYFQNLAAEKNITLVYHFPKEDIHLFVDVERVLQIISNLLNNAIKFTESNGHITVEVELLEDKVRVGVIDTGIGIAKEDLAKIFEKFVQVVPLEELRAKGVGLGLSIAKELVERHGGEIWVESKLGVGSKFYFTLPRYFTTKVLDRSIKDKIREFLDDNVPVCLINILIVNFEEFKKRIRVGAQKLSQDLKNIITENYEQVFGKVMHQRERFFVTELHGKCTIILPDAGAKEVNRFSEGLKQSIKDYFLKYQINDVFIALGIMSYSATFTEGEAGQAFDNVNVKEIYIGSEMRRSKRINYKTNIQIFLPDETQETCETIDLSWTGVCAVTRKSFKTDEKLNVSLDLLRTKQTLTLPAKIRWIHKMDKLPGESIDYYKIGLEFEDLEIKNRKLLTKELQLNY
ncbi:MAG: hypothetical protein A2Z88_11560 [Omnitrophica WOR_2 bacterium GWA2_47_8]|nr:MAG: hypothetical protein A2Z88_11560 [Omnitrophica WOR_2 bacterium GWA2_47_8]